MKTERHNVAGRMIIKAQNKSSWGASLANICIGCVDRLAHHNLQIPARASNRIIPPYQETCCGICSLCWARRSAPPTSRRLNLWFKPIKALKKEKKKKCAGRGNPPYINEGKEDTLAEKSLESPRPRSYKLKILMGIWRIIGSTRLHNLAAR
eukprot:441042-Pelagomonas_calceolata.AAC.1